MERDIPCLGAAHLGKEKHPHLTLGRGMHVTALLRQQLG